MVLFCSPMLLFWSSQAAMTFFLVWQCSLKLFLLLLHKCNFAIVMNHNVSVWYTVIWYVISPPPHQRVTTHRLRTVVLEDKGSIPSTHMEAVQCLSICNSSFRGSWWPLLAAAGDSFWSPVPVIPSVGRFLLGSIHANQEVLGPAGVLEANTPTPCVWALSIFQPIYLRDGM